MNLAFSYKNRPKSERQAFARYAEFCKLEPRLMDLLRDVMEQQPTTGRWIALFEDRVKELIGWNCSVEGIRTSEAYDIAYSVLYSFVFDKEARN